ncbi:unnamed protein product [Boreogadus saida]
MRSERGGPEIFINDDSWTLRHTGAEEVSATLPAAAGVLAGWDRVPSTEPIFYSAPPCGQDSEDQEDQDSEDQDSEDQDSEDQEDQDSEDQDSEDQDSEDQEDQDSEDQDSEDQDSEDQDSEDQEDQDSEDQDSEDQDSEDQEDQDSEDQDSEDQDSEDHDFGRDPPAEQQGGLVDEAWMLQEVSMRAPGRRQAELTAALDVGSRDEDISHCEPGSSSIESSSSAETLLAAGTPGRQAACEEQLLYFRMMCIRTRLQSSL